MQKPEASPETVKQTYVASRAVIEKSQPDRVVIPAPPACDKCHGMQPQKSEYKRYPVRISHKRHFELGIECIFCHRKAPSSTDVLDYLIPDGHGFTNRTGEDGLPDSSPCKACHIYFSEYGKKDENIKAECVTCHTSYSEEEPLKPSPVLFQGRLINNHKTHFDRGVPCLRCHVDFDKLEEPVSSYTPTRDLCTECHDNGARERNRDKLNPPSAPSAAAELFLVNCAVCHGKEGRGDGLVADFFKAGLRPRDLTDPVHMEKRSDEQIFNVIYRGGPELFLSERMPAWEGLLGEDEVKALAAYVRKLSAYSSAADK